VQLSVRPGNGFIVQSGSFVASTADVLLDTQWQEFTKGLFGSEFFMLKVTGDRELFANAYGGIIQKELLPGENMSIDNYHLVALGEHVGVQRNSARRAQDKHTRWRGVHYSMHRTGTGLVSDKEPA
jgi:uncharacterized protein (AIM24 family)